MTLTDIRLEMASARTDKQLAVALRKLSTVLSHERADRADYANTREQAIILAELATGERFWKILSTYLDGE